MYKGGAYRCTFISLILLAFTLSLDSCSVGLTYGLRSVRIPLRSIIIIGMCSAAVMLVSMGIGHMIAKVFSPVIATRIGGLVLIGIGIWVLYQFFEVRKRRTEARGEGLEIRDCLARASDSNFKETDCSRF